jgi:hypothetical protein
MNPL